MRTPIFCGLVIIGIAINPNIPVEFARLIWFIIIVSFVMDFLEFFKKIYIDD